ncbi:alpha-ketoacid dehydrogenase kinase [Atractiella rhizophila]|nr:alpha-ketoacid dehydrogenase kinase [Atractiella rhizophila]
MQRFYQNKTLETYASRAVFPISLRQLIFFGRQTRLRDGVDKKETERRLIKGANFLQTELPIRLSHRVRDLQSLPFIVATHPSLELVYSLYQDAFERIRNYPTVTTLDENEDFCEFMTKLMGKHQVVIPQLAIALAEAPKTALPISTLDAFLTRMLRSRISRRVMTSQHIALSRQFEEGKEDGYVGIVNTKLKPDNAVRKCAKMLRLQEAGGEKVDDKRGSIIIDIVGDGEREFPYVEEHLEYVIFELLKNSIRATREKHPERPEDFPITATVVMGERTVTIRISDQGGGIPRLSPEPASIPTDPDSISSSSSSSLLTPLFSTAARREIFSFGHMHSRTNLMPNDTMFEKEMIAKTWREAKLEGTVKEQFPTEKSEKGERRKRDGAKEKENGTMRDFFVWEKRRLGLGLTLSRIYAEYFGGSIKVYSMDNYGSDAYFSVPRVGDTVEASS